MRFTVFGATGFIGANLVAHLSRRGHEVRCPKRDLPIEAGDHLGHVIYAIGLTANFRSRPYETVEAHVGLLSRLLQTSCFDSWLYLSSTRVYAGLLGASKVDEEVRIPIAPSSSRSAGSW